MDSTIIKIDNVTVRFNMASQKVRKLKEFFILMVKRQLHFNEFLALKNVNFEVKRGETWGIIGKNGAGKSTLLKVICNVISPYSGKATVKGKISPMLELGAGFDTELTGNENIILQGLLLGYSRKFIKEHYNEIAEFSELGEFLDIPVKNYSSGMVSRLAFAIATVVKPEILIVDEVLSVGDAAFQKKCKDRIHEMISGSTTLLLVSHSSKVIKSLCQKAIWMNNGEVVMSGDAEEVCEAYEKSSG